MPKITPQNAAELARRSHEPNCRDSRPNAIHSISQMQDKLKSLTLSEKVPGREAAQCAIAWDKLEARKAILRGLPANTSQSIRVDTPKKTRRQSQQVTAPIESEQDEPRTDPPSDQVPDEGKK